MQPRLKIERDKMLKDQILTKLGFTNAELEGGSLVVHTPVDGSIIAHVHQTPLAEVDKVIEQSRDAFLQWRKVPAPVRGELVRLLGEELRWAKDNLGQLVSLECGKILSEGHGEVQEMIDICDFAVGLSRQLYGLTIASERPGHRMMETWHPLGPVGIITAFNFPVAVWAWNAALALVCGNSLIWKPSEKTPLTALACQKIFERAVERFGEQAPEYLSQVIVGEADVGDVIVTSGEVPLISATGSTPMGRVVGAKVAARFGKSILELGGNNAMIVAPSADLDMAVRAIVFSAVGTCGQRCTSLRRVIAHESVRKELIKKIVKAYESLPIGSPLEEKTLVGPLIDDHSVELMLLALKQAEDDGGIIHGGDIFEEKDGAYVHPAVVEMPEQTDVVKRETFAPILYVMEYTDLDTAIAVQNDVPQGLSSCIFTTDIREAEYFMSAVGSDCGIANVNIGPSGAEIGGAFGGEKETGGGRESGSDAWKAYMRRQTNTINYSTELPLAQGVKFEI